MSKPVFLTTESLTKLSDGVFSAAFDRSMETAIADVVDRGHDGKPRKVTATFTLKYAGDGKYTIVPDVKVTVPPIVPAPTVAKYDKRAGGLVFKPDSAGNPDQMTMDDIEGEIE